MALKAPKGNQNKQFAPQANIEPGTYPARLVQIIDFGLQPQKPYQGKEKAPVNEIGLTYELVDEFMKDENGNDIEDKPRWISETLPFYSLNSEKAKSTQRYFAFDPNNDFDGDFSQLLGRPINVTVVNNQVGDKVYDNVATVSGMRPKDADKCPELKNEAKMFDLDDPDIEVFNKLPKWIQDKIKGNLNYEGSKLQKSLGKEVAEEAQGQRNVQEKVKNQNVPVEKEEDNNPY